MRIRIRSFLLAIACAAACNKTRVDQLSERTEVFNRNLRWSSLAAASAFVADKNRKTLVEKIAKDLNNNRIVDFLIVDMALDPEKKNGSIVIEYSFYGVSDQNVRVRREVQYWEYDNKKKNWFLSETREIAQKASQHTE
jgi:hypothetical protein